MPTTSTAQPQLAPDWLNWDQCPGNPIWDFKGFGNHLGRFQDGEKIKHRTWSSIVRIVQEK